MDPVTHAAFGVVCALACTGRRKELRRPAVVAGMLAGLMPDLDIFLKSETDPLFNLEYHRHFTHSVVFAPVIALVVAAFTSGCWRWIGGKVVSVWVLFLPALVAALGHGFCDVWTSYGTRTWWPFSERRVTLDLIAVIDPVFSLPLLVGAVVAWIMASRRLAWMCLGWVVLYLGLCQVQQVRAKTALMDWVVAQGLESPQRVTLKPSLGNIVVWRGLVVHGEVVRVAAIRCGLGRPQLLAGQAQRMYVSPKEAIEMLGLKSGSEQARAVERFAHFSDDWIGPHPKDEMVVGDLRYSALPNDHLPLWGIRVNPASPDEAVEMSYFREIRKGDLEKFWRMIKGEGWD